MLFRVLLCNIAISTRKINDYYQESMNVLLKMMKWQIGQIKGNGYI